jgi:CHAD domain-containing protein
VRARKVKGLAPEMPLAEALQRIAETRLKEVRSFEHAVHDPDAVEDLHDMRIAAKRLRYVLEMSEPVLGAKARHGAKQAKKLQELLGEIHDCDEHLPLVERHLARLRGEDATAVAATAARTAADLEPAAARDAPHRRHYAGLEALAAYLRARRDVLYRRFVREWARLEKADFAASLNGEVT